MTLEIWFSYRGSKKDTPIQLTIYEDGGATEHALLCKTVHANHPHIIFAAHSRDPKKTKVAVQMKYIIEEDPDDNEE